MMIIVSSNMKQTISELIWDFMFLEGIVAIFKSFLAIMSILEHQLLQKDEFNELYVILDTQPNEVIQNESLFLKHFNKFS